MESLAEIVTLSTRDLSVLPCTDLPDTSTSNSEWGFKSACRPYFYNVLTDETRWEMDQESRLPFIVIKVPDSSMDWSWDGLTSRSVKGLSNLMSHVQAKAKEFYVDSASDIVESISKMPGAVGTNHGVANDVLIHQRHLLAHLSKLALSAKLASMVWPTPDAQQNLVEAISLVLEALYPFSKAAQDACIQIQPQLLSKRIEDEPKPSLSYPCLLSQLEKSRVQLVELISSLDTLSMRNERLSSTSLSKNVDQSHLIVAKVAHFISLADETPLDSKNEALLLELKTHRDDLETASSSFFMCLETAKLSPDTVGETMESEANRILEAAQNLLITVKFLIDEKEVLDDASLKQYVDLYGAQRDSGISFRPRLSTNSKRDSLRLSALSIDVGLRAIQEEGSLASPVSAIVGSVVDLPKRPIRSSFRAYSPPSPSSPKNKFNLLNPRLELERAEKRLYRMSKIQQLLGTESPRAPILEDSSWQFKPDYNPEELLFNLKGQVRGGTVRALVDKLTLPDVLDVDFMIRFLLTYRSFTTSDELLRLLIGRFFIRPPPLISDSDKVIWIEKKQAPIRIRVLNVFKTWTRDHMDDEDRDVLKSIKIFAETSMQYAMPNASGPLVRLVEQRLGLVPMPERVPTTPPLCPPSILPRRFGRVKSYHLDPLEVARQLSLYESTLFTAIPSRELLSWSKKTKSSLESCPHIQEMILGSNQMTNWVCHVILEENLVRKRGKRISFFIDVAEKCASLNNFNSLMSIIAGLNSAPIHRLAKSWDWIGTKKTRVFQDLCGIMSPTKNFGQYRELLRSLDPPCVPFLGFYLTDLTFIEQGTPSILHHRDDFCHFQKMAQLADVLREVSTFKQSCYSLSLVPSLLSGLRHEMRDSPETDTLYHRSLELEPKLKDLKRRSYFF